MVTVFNFIYLTVMFYICITLKQEAKDGRKYWGSQSEEIADTFPYLFSILFVGQSASVFILIKKLRLKNEYVEMD